MLVNLNIGSNVSMNGLNNRYIFNGMIFQVLPKFSFSVKTDNSELLKVVLGRKYESSIGTLSLEICSSIVRSLLGFSFDFRLIVSS